MSNSRKHFTPQEKVCVLRSHLLDRLPVSELCEKHGIHPTVLYRWQKELFENGAAAFDRRDSREERRQQQRIEELEGKLQRKNEVLSELMEEHVALKKLLGETEGGLGAPRHAG